MYAYSWNIIRTTFTVITRRRRLLLLYYLCGDFAGWWSNEVVTTFVVGHAGARSYSSTNAQQPAGWNYTS